MKTEFNDRSHQNLTLCLDSLALLLYGSELYESNDLPLTTKEWLDLERTLRYSKFKKPAALLSLEYETMIIDLDIEPELAMRLFNRNQGISKLLNQLYRFESMGIFITTKYEDSYPVLLHKKMKKDAPLILYYSGDITLLSQPMMGVTGPTRTNKRMDANTKIVTNKLYEEGYVLIGCHQKGIEEKALKQQLRLGGKGITFVCDHYLKEMKEYKKQIKNGQLLLVSAHLPFSNFDVVHAIDRNQYVFCFAEAMIVMYSQINSGVVWLSAMQNFKQKWTKLAAVVDDEFYGNARLIELGAVGLTMDMIQSPLMMTELLEQEEPEKIEDPTYDQLSIFEFID